MYYCKIIIPKFKFDMPNMIDPKKRMIPVKKLGDHSCLKMKFANAPTFCWFTSTLENPITNSRLACCSLLLFMSDTNFGDLRESFYV